jgi:ribose transport system substrate-binding protein
VTLALRVLEGDAPAESTVLVVPALWENVTEDGRATIEAAQNPMLDPEWPVSVSISDWTTYSMEEIIACKGPGE